MEELAQMLSPKTLRQFLDRSGMLHLSSVALVGMAPLVRNFPQLLATCAQTRCLHKERRFKSSSVLVSIIWTDRRRNLEVILVSWQRHVTVVLHTPATKLAQRRNLAFSREHNHVEVITQLVDVMTARLNLFLVL